MKVHGDGTRCLRARGAHGATTHGEEQVSQCRQRAKSSGRAGASRIHSWVRLWSPLPSQARGSAPVMGRIAAVEPFHGFGPVFDGRVGRGPGTAGMEHRQRPGVAAHGGHGRGRGGHHGRLRHPFAAAPSSSAGWIGWCARAWPAPCEPAVERPGVMTVERQRVAQPVRVLHHGPQQRGRSHAAEWPHHDDN